MECYNEIIEENINTFAELSNSQIRVNHIKIVEQNTLKGFEGLIEDISEISIK